MKKFSVLIFLFLGFLVFISCQKETDIVTKYNPVPVFTVGSYDNTTVEGVLAYMDPLFYNSINAQDSPYCPVLMAGSYAENLPDKDGRRSGLCVNSKRMCIILCSIPNNFQDFSTMSTTYGYDMNEPIYRDIMVICKEDEPVMQQGLYYSIVYNTSNEVTDVEMTGIDAETITYHNNTLEIIPE